MTILEALRTTEDTLRTAGVGSPGTDACLLVAHALGDTLSHLPTRLREELAAEAAARLEPLVARRAAREPLAYVLGDTEFMSLRFLCDSRAFVPRPDTETLVEVVLEAVRAADRPAVRIAEIGTGTGCIAISLAHYLPQAQVIATDASPEALSLARENVLLNGVQDRVTLLEGRDLDPLLAAGVSDEIEVLVSNPPYIPSPEVPTLEPEVSAAEPRLALDGGPDGLDFYRRVLPQLAQWPALWLVAFEFGYDQEDAVAEIVRRHLEGWTIAVRKDLAGLPRVVVARK
jgi:release factor glutamine methyltransferase